MSREWRRLSEASDEAARFQLSREWFDPILVARFTIDGEPQSKARARHTKGGNTYSPTANRDAEQVIAWKYKQASKTQRPDAENALGVVALFFSSTQQRRDVDNMLKLILDGLNKIAWADDSQVTEISGRKELVDDPSDARTEVAVYCLGPLRQRTGTCEQCGATFPAFRSQKGRRFCSKECDYARRRAARTRTCIQCGAQFEETGPAKYCSLACNSAAKSVVLTCAQCGCEFTRARSLAPKQVPTCGEDCRVAYWRQRRAVKAKGTCADCGGPTSKKSYTRCQACAVVAKGAPIARKPFGPNGQLVLTIREVS